MVETVILVNGCWTHARFFTYQQHTRQSSGFTARGLLAMSGIA